jgi:hypothetical protein
VCGRGEQTRSRGQSTPIRILSIPGANHGHVIDCTGDQSRPLLTESRCGLKDFYRKPVRVSRCSAADDASTGR